jgi:hypothetical protein
MLAVGAVGASMILAACSSSKGGGGTGNGVTSKETPQQAVATALANTGRQSSLQVSLSLPITAAQAQQISGSHSGMTAGEAKALTTGTLFFAETTGHGEGVDTAQAQTDPMDSFDVGLTVGSDTPVEIRYVGQNLFARAQLRQLLTDAGDNPAKAAKVSAFLNQINAVVPGINALGQGDWVEITHSGLTSLGTSLKQGAPGASNPSALRSQFTALRYKILAAVQANTTFANLGNQGGRTEYSLTINVPAVVNSVGPEIASALNGIPGLGSRISGALSGAQGRLQDAAATVVDVYVSDNKLSEADLDVNQFKHKYSFAIPLRVAFSSPGAPSAPSGATVLDVSKVPSFFSNMFGGASSSTPTT